jgi:WD40 repeat protein
MADVFISYSRTDKDFVRKLHDALAKLNREMWVDWKDIPLTAEWLKEIYAGIEAADNFVFVISPESVVSAACLKEIAHASENNKRLIPIFHRAVHDAAIPESLARINFIYLRDSDDFESTFASLVDAIDSDLEWKRMHTRLLVRAKEWEREGGDMSYLLRGNDLREAEGWQSRGPRKEPKPTSIQSEYILSSGMAEVHRQRLTLGAVMVALLVAVGLAITALIQRNTAKREATIAQSRQLAAQSERVRPEALSSVVPAALLATESMQRLPLLENDRALREATLMLPRQVASFVQDGVAAAALSHDGRFLATIAGAFSSLFSHEASLRVFEVLDQKEVWRGNPIDPSVVALSQDGHRVAIGSYEDQAAIRLCVFQLPGTFGSCKYLTHPDYSWAVGALVFSPNGSDLALATGRSVQLWDTSEMKPLWDRTDAKHIHMIAFSPSGEFLAFGTDGGDVRVLRATDGLAISDLSASNTAVAASFSPDSRYIATGSSNGTVTMFNIATRETMFHLAPGGDVRAIAYRTDGHLYYLKRMTDNLLQVFDAGSGSEVSRLTTQSEVRSATFSSDGRYLAVVTADGYARVSEIVAREEVSQLRPAGTLAYVALSPDGHLATLDTKRTLSVFDATSGAKIWGTAEGELIGPLAFNSDGKLLVSGSDSGIVRTFEAGTGKTASGLEPRANVTTLTFSIDGRLMFTRRSDRVGILETANGEQVSQLWCNGDQRVDEVAVSPDGKYVAVGSGNTARVCSRSSGKIFWGSTGASKLGALAFSPDGRYLATGSSDTTVRTFKVNTGEEVSRQSLGGAVSALSYSRDARYLITASELEGGIVDVQKRFYRPEDLIADTCSRVTRNLTVSEWRSYVGAEIPYHKTCPKLP